MNPIDRIEQLQAELARVTAENERLSDCINKSESVTERGNLVGEIHALHARVADYEERLSAVMPSDFKDWNQNARSEWPEVAARVIQSLVEREHFANGTAELAMHHRDIAEQRVAELEAALEELYEAASRFPMFDGSRLASALDSASAALAEPAAPLPMREDPRYRGTDFRSAIDVDRASQGGGK